MKNVAERQTYNGGLWIPVGLKYSMSDDKKSLEMSSYAYVMGTNLPVENFAGMHYCKLLSPFRALEWIYVDSLYAEPTLYSSVDEEEAAAELKLLSERDT